MINQILMEPKMMRADTDTEKERSNRMQDLGDTCWYVALVVSVIVGALVVFDMVARMWWWG